MATKAWASTIHGEYFVRFRLTLTWAIRLESFDFSTMEKLFTQLWNWVIFCLLVVINTDVDATLFTKKVVVKSLYGAVSFNNLPWRALLLEIYFWNAWIFCILRLFFIVIHHFCMAGVFKPHFSSHDHIYSKQWLLHWKQIVKDHFINVLPMIYFILIGLIRSIIYRMIENKIHLIIRNSLTTGWNRYVSI